MIPIAGVNMEEGTYCPIRKFGEVGGFWLLYEELLWGGFTSRLSALSFASEMKWQNFYVGLGGVKFFWYKPQLFGSDWHPVIVRVRAPLRPDSWLLLL